MSSGPAELFYFNGVSLLLHYVLMMDLLTITVCTNKIETLVLFVVVFFPLVPDTVLGFFLADPIAMIRK